MDTIYENNEKILGHPRELKSSQDTSISGEVIQTVQAETTRPGFSDAEGVKKSSCRTDAIFLGLLCFFLLFGLKTLGCLFAQGKSETVMLQKLDDNMTSEINQLQAVIQDCQNWVVFNGSLYHVSSSVRSWQQSRNDCLHRGADLMIINSQEEQNFANQFNKYLWFGMTDSETEGSWKWVDGTPVTTSYWAVGEPNGGTNENCGQIMKYNFQNSWNDEGCLSSHFWICEKRVSP